MKKSTRAWVQKAEADWRGAQLAEKARPRLNDLACFLCQQCAEKYLKALLDQHGLRIPRIHDLDDLRGDLTEIEPTVVILASVCLQLNQYAVDYRYPGFKAKAREVKRSIRSANSIRATVRRALGLRG